MKYAITGVFDHSFCVRNVTANLRKDAGAHFPTTWWELFYFQISLKVGKFSS